MQRVEPTPSTPADDVDEFCAYLDLAISVSPIRWVGSCLEYALVTPSTASLFDSCYPRNLQHGMKPTLRARCRPIHEVLQQRVVCAFW
jgi:hypothetical protein